MHTSQTLQYIQLEAPDRCAQLFDHERYLITDKHTEVLYFMIFQNACLFEMGDKRTDGRYQTYYLPCFAVDNKYTAIALEYMCSVWNTACAVDTAATLF